MKKILIILLAICAFSFKPDKVKIELSVQEVQMVIDGLRSSKLQSWQANEIIEKIATQANQQLIDTTKKK